MFCKQALLDIERDCIVFFDNLRRNRMIHFLLKQIQKVS